MDVKTKTIMRNMVVDALSNGQDCGSVKEKFLTMRMVRDFGEECYFGSPSLQDIYDNLIACDIIDNKDISTEYIGQGRTVPRLNVRLSPEVCLHVGRTTRGLSITVNESGPTFMYINPGNATNVLMWVIRQKRNLNLYLQEWEELFKESAKTVKGKRMAFLAIQAIFTEAMKDYPQLRYEIVEQKRRARIKVKIPNSNLGVCLDGWWGKYKEQLPKQIESLKALIEVHRNSAIKIYTTYR